MTDDDERVLARLGARDPQGVKILLKKHGAEKVSDLIPILQHKRRKTNPRERFYRWWLRLGGGRPYEPVVSPYLKRLKREGRLSDEPGVIWGPRRW